MINKKNTGRLLGVTLGLIYVTLTALMTRALWQGLPTTLVVLLFLVLFIGFYFTGMWILVDRPAEIDEKFPTSTQELRRRKKRFYDWLDSQWH
jgi:cell division protein FtsW (lipid II flippase)